VVSVAGDVGNRTRPNVLNSDGRRHPVENVAAIAILLDGLLAFVLGLLVRNVSTAGAALHIIATATGLLAILAGLFAQMASSTREQRVLIVTGMIAGFVGLALGLSHGGFVA
jgi:uncharacterized membrane protein HdeD (DUF308 family)